jgi:hypothetical protein
MYMRIQLFVLISIWILPSTFLMQAAHPIFVQKQSHYVASLQLISGYTINLIFDSPPIAGAAITWLHFRDGFLEADKRAY